MGCGASASRVDQPRQTAKAEAGTAQSQPNDAEVGADEENPNMDIDTTSMAQAVQHLHFCPHHGRYSEGRCPKCYPPEKPITEFQITVTKMNGEEVASFLAGKDEAIMTIKERVKAQAGIALYRQRLLHGTDILENTELLCQLRVAKGVAAVQLTLVLLDPVTVTKVEMRTGDLVDLIEFHYSNGTKESVGAMGGVAQSPFLLNEDEFITAIHGRHGDSLDGIQFETNAGRKSQFYGNPKGGRAFSMSASGGAQIWSVKRGMGWKHCGKISKLVEHPALH